MKAAKKNKPATKKAAKKPAKKAAKDKKPTATATKKKVTAAAKADKKVAKDKKPAKKSTKAVTAEKKKVEPKRATNKPSESKAKESKAKAKESKAKHWFPKDAKPDLPAKAPAKKSPWQRKMVPINYGTIGGPVTNIKDLFHKYIDDNHKKMTPEQRQSLWQAVGLRMIGNDRNSLSEIIDQEIKGASGSV